MCYLCDSSMSAIEILVSSYSGYNVPFSHLWRFNGYLVMCWNISPPKFEFLEMLQLAFCYDKPLNCDFTECVKYRPLHTGPQICWVYCNSLVTNRGQWKSQFILYLYPLIAQSTHAVKHSLPAPLFGHMFKELRKCDPCENSYIGSICQNSEMRKDEGQLQCRYSVKGDRWRKIFWKLRENQQAGGLKAS